MPGITTWFCRPSYLDEESRLKLCLVLRPSFAARYIWEKLASTLVTKEKWNHAICHIFKVAGFSDSCSASRLTARDAVMTANLIKLLRSYVLLRSLCM